MPVFAEGRVEHQKLNQTTALLLFGWVIGVQLDYSCRLKSVSATSEKRVFKKSNLVSVGKDFFLVYQFYRRVNNKADFS